MRILSVRLILSLVLGISLVSVVSSYYEVRVEEHGLQRDLERRTAVLGESLTGNVERSLEQGTPHELQRLVERFGNREHLAGIAVYDVLGNRIAVTPALTQVMDSEPPSVVQAIRDNRGQGQFTRAGSASIHIYALPLHNRLDQIEGGLAIVHDTGYIGAQTRRVWRETFVRVLTEMVLIALVTLLIVRWSLSGPIARAAQWMRALRTGRTSSSHSAIPDWDVFQPLAREVATFAESLKHARSAAETEAQLREAAESVWTAERLAVHVRSKLGNSRLVAVSNREPYFHTRRGRNLEVVVPASGLVTALEPVLRACDGTWIAHGSGDADQETVDRNDRLRVPPDDPRYTLRRIWLSREEEEGYYYGFANEGLWPLCHIAHTRPLFRASDWNYYQQVNRKFADAALEETKDNEQPVLLVQDYHFALLPRMIKQSRPDARVAIFWHIPWPNPEAFDICPWQRELLDGLLGADLIGFHVQAHCNNFLQTVDRALESQINWEHFTVTRGDHRTLVRPFPISVDFNEFETPGTATPSADSERAAVLKQHGVEAIFMGVGVDRVDYTKGIPERFLAIERLLEQYPTFQQQFTFVQIAAPSRTHIKRYHDLLDEVEAEANRINQRFQTANWRPIVLLKRQHSHHEIQRYYRAADVCMVTALHDGMNLVAKEFLAARDDEDGVLILSRFTGAARELRDALLVNPYDVDGTADAIRRALAMDPDERKLRMQRMRRFVSEHNIYRWAGSLIAELCDVRTDVAGKKPEEVGTGHLSGLKA
jgi:alpha,alpha-trehalose-phosphate synthase [UDP-forming]